MRDVNICIFNRIKGYIGEYMFIKWNCLQSRISQGQGVVWEGRLCSSTGERAPHTPKYLDQLLIVVLATFTIVLVFARQLKQDLFGLQLHIQLNILISSQWFCSQPSQQGSFL